MWGWELLNHLLWVHLAHQLVGFGEPAEHPLSVAVSAVDVHGHHQTKLCSSLWLGSVWGALWHPQCLFRGSKKVDPGIFLEQCWQGDDSCCGAESTTKKKDAVNSPPGWQRRQHSVSCVPQSGSVLILLKSHQCFLHVPSADGAVALSSWARAWFVSIWFSEETWSQLGQQKNPPGRILGSHTEGPCFSVTWWWLTPAAGGSPSTGQPPNWSSQKC